MNFHDALNAAVVERLAAARDTQPAPAPEYVVVRDTWTGCEYIAPSTDGDRRFVHDVAGAERYAKDHAELVAESMGNGWRVRRPT